jgi:hypothetical protein
LKNQPLSNARDFFIYQFLDQDISKQEANEALKLVKNLKGKFVHKFAKKGDDEQIEKKVTLLQAKS